MKRDVDKNARGPFEPLLYYLDGSLDPAGVAKLNAKLKADPILQRHLAYLLVQQCHLLDLGHEQKIAARESVPNASVIRWPNNSAVRRARLARLGKGMLAITSVMAVMFGIWQGIPWLLQDSLVVESTEGFDVFVLRQDKQIDARAGFKIKPGDIVKTTDDGEIWLRYRRDNMTAFSMSKNCELEILPSSQGKRLKLMHGVLAFDAAIQKPGTPLIVTTPNAQLKVLGARFRLQAESSATLVAVTSGRAELAKESATTIGPITAGQYGIVEPGLERIATLDSSSIRGVVLAELWSNIRGATVAEFTGDPRFQSSPNRVVSMFKLETPPEAVAGNDSWTKLGVRIRGYLYPPLTGDYTFWITSDDSAEFWLSSNASVSGGAKICWNMNFTKPEDWTAEPNQQSKPVHLQSGQTYYFEILHKELWSPNFLRVAWEYPGINRTVIGGHFLSPFFTPQTLRSLSEGLTF